MVERATNEAGIWRRGGASFGGIAEAAAARNERREMHCFILKVSPTKPSTGALLENGKIARWGDRKRE